MRVWRAARVDLCPPDGAPATTHSAAALYNGFMRTIAAALLMAAALGAETHVLTLQQAVDLAIKQSPDILMARLDGQKAIDAVRVAKDPFTPRIMVGSGLAYSSGFPMSIEGSAPSIVQANASQFLFNRPQSYAVAQAKQNARTAAIVTQTRRDEVVFRVASLFLDAERAAQVADTAGKDLESLQKVQQSVQARIQEGRELPLEGKKAALNLARGRQAVEAAQDDQQTAETALAVVLGFSPGDRVRPAREQRAAPPMPVSEEEAVEAAVRNSSEIHRLRSEIVAKGLELRGDRAARLPRVDLVAQYGLFARFNNYEDFFRRFQRHNGQLGISFQLPLLPGPGVAALTAQREAETSRLRTELNAARGRIDADTRAAWRDLHRAETAREVARLDLDVAREQLSVNLALMQEGRLPLAQVEASRVVENDKWIAFYDAEYAVERARWALLRQTGELMAALR